MNLKAVAIVPLLIATNAFAQACWNEWAYKEQWLNRAGQCSENISIADFERGFCQVRVQDDQLRTAAKCPTSAKEKVGLEVRSHPVVARCLGVRPPGAKGAANTFYYGGKSFTDSRDSLRQLCTGFQGKWAEGAP